MAQQNNSGSPWGILLAGGLVAWGVWRALSQEKKQSFSAFLDRLGAQLQQEAQERERKRVAQELLTALPKPLPPTKLDILNPDAGPLLKLDFSDLFSGTKVNAAPALPLDPDARFRQVITHPSVVLVLGKRGSGKSALGYRLLELFRYGPRPYVVGVPNSARKLLPDWIGIASTLEEVPPKSIALVDEAYLAYHARGSMAQQSKAMSQFLNLSRQRDQTLIFVSQEARQVDRNIASSANVVVFKDLGMLQLEFDRPELNKLAAQAKEAFAKVIGDRRRWSFVYAPDGDHLGLQENQLPTFWKPSLSHLFAVDAAPATPRAGRKMTPQEKAQKAKNMRAQGASYREIAQALGVTRGTVINYLKGYPYHQKTS
jgi:hypothetical protein